MSKGFSNIQFIEVSYEFFFFLCSSAVKFYCRRLLEFKCSCFCLFCYFLQYNHFFPYSHHHHLHRRTHNQLFLLEAFTMNQQKFPVKLLLSYRLCRFLPVIFKWKTLGLTKHKLFCHLTLIY